MSGEDDSSNLHTNLSCYGSPADNTASCASVRSPDSTSNQCGIELFDASRFFLAYLQATFDDLRLPPAESARSTGAVTGLAKFVYLTREQSLARRLEMSEAIADMQEAIDAQPSLKLSTKTGRRVEDVWKALGACLQHAESEYGTSIE